MSAPRQASGSAVKLPPPGEDATPFLVRCCVKAAPFRPLQEFEHARPYEEEFKLYVWRSATLRDIASLLHMREPTLSSPLSHHAFRIVYYDAQSHAWSAREAGSGVTLMERSTFEDVLDSVYTATSEEDKDGLFTRTVQRTRPRMSNEVDEEASQRTLNALHLADGEILDCVIMSFPGKIGKRIRGIGEERSEAGYANRWGRAREDQADRTAKAR